MIKHLKSAFAILIFFSFILILFVSCEEKRNASTTDTTSVKPSDTSTLAILKAKKDSTDKAWALMIQSDDQKINDIKRLLKEISYCKKYNAFLLDSLTETVNVMKEKRYAQTTMRDEEINEYDAYTDRIISRTKYLARTTEELQLHPIAEVLYNDIAKADNDVALYRSLYDRFAMDYNMYLQNNKAVLGQEGDAYKPYPVFTISLQ